MIGGIQPKVMPNIFRSVNFDDGLISRFLFYMTEQKNMRFSNKGIDSSSMDVLGICS